MNERERYVFDTQGCLLIEDVLTKDEVDRLTKGFPRDAEGEVIPEPNECVLNLREPLFRELVNHPRILPYLGKLLADVHVEHPWSRQFFLSHEDFMYLRPGQQATRFHNGGTPYDPWLSYTVRDGKIFCGQVVVFWLLTDQREGKGGFWYIPGSHQANFAKPEGLEEYDWIPDCAVQPVARAGSVILFTEALTHGTRPWEAEFDRYAIFYRYLPAYMSLYVNPSEERTRLLSEEQKRYVVLPE